MRRLDGKVAIVTGSTSGGADLTVRNGPGRSFDQLLDMSGVPVAAVSTAHSG